MTFINERTHLAQCYLPRGPQQEHKRNIHEHEYRQNNYVMSMKNNKVSKQ